MVGIGECMVELSPAGDGLFKQSFAGDVLNTLWYSRAGLDHNWTVRFLSAVGVDPVSQDMLAFIEDGGIDCSLVRRTPDRRPGLYMIQLDGAERSFTYWRDRSAARLLAEDRQHLATSIKDAGVVYLSGITLAILPEDDAMYLLECLKGAKAGGKIIVFDPNIRPSLWTSPDWMRDLIHLVAAQATIVMPSFDDERTAFSDETPEATLARYIGKGAEIVILKNGSDAVMVSADGRLESFPTSIVAEPVDTTGAGDAFNGAFIAEYVRSGAIERAVRAGQACAANVVRHHGALIAN